MTEYGKIDAATFERVVAPNLGGSRDDVALGPTAGVDFGVVTVDDRALVLATDPLSILPDLDPDRAGRLATDIVLTDVAVSGVAPTHLSVALTLPRSLPDDSISAVWGGIVAQTRRFGVRVASEYVGRYPGVDSSWVGGATAVGVGDPDAVVRPDGARPGDALVVSTGPAAEVAGLFATRYPEALGLPAATVATARERVDDIPAVGDALAAHDAGRVTAMHDATEGGLVGALVEMADGAGVRFEVDRDAVPVADGVEAVCDAIDVEPWHVTSCGTLVVAVEPADAAGVVAALERRDTPAAVVGSVTDGEGVFADGERVTPPDRDPSWDAARRLAARE